MLKLRLNDIQDRKLILREPKSGKEHEIVFIPQKVADRLRDYAIQICSRTQMTASSRLPMQQPALVVKKAGEDDRHPLETA